MINQQWNTKKVTCWDRLNGELRARYFSFFSTETLTFKVQTEGKSTRFLKAVVILQLEICICCCSTDSPLAQSLSTHHRILLLLLWHWAATAVRHPGPLWTGSSAVWLYEMHCGSQCRCEESLSSGTGLLAVSTTAYQPLSVCLDLHCAPAETVGVEQQVAGLRLDVLPVVSTRGRCENKHACEYIKLHTECPNRMYSL